MVERLLSECKRAERFRAIREFRETQTPEQTPEQMAKYLAGLKNSPRSMRHCPNGDSHRRHSVGRAGVASGREQGGQWPAIMVPSNEYLAAVDTEILVVPVTSRSPAWPNHVPLTGPTQLERAAP